MVLASFCFSAEYAEVVEDADVVGDADVALLTT